MKRLFEELLRIRLQEDKTRLIDKLDLTNDEKEEIKSFFKTHSNLESKIDWNNKNLTYYDFKKLMSDNEKSRSNRKRAIKDKLSLAFEGMEKDVKIWYEDKNIIFVSPITYEGSKFMQSVYNRPSNWCVSTSNPTFWRRYVKDGAGFLFIYIAGKEKYMIEVENNDDYGTLWDERDRDVYRGDLESIMGYLSGVEMGVQVDEEKAYETDLWAGYFDYLFEDNRSMFWDLLKDILEMFHEDIQPYQVSSAEDYIDWDEEEEDED